MSRCIPYTQPARFIARARNLAVVSSPHAYIKCPWASAHSPERVIAAGWGNVGEARQQEGLYAADIIVDANDRQGLLRDISEVLSREKINVTAVKTLSRTGSARMSFTVELNGVPQLQRMLMLVREVPGVVNAWRG